jgi:AraC-like DNA-binding protein
MVKILPQLFYETPDIQKILVDGLSCVVHKTIDQAVWHKEGYVSTHAITMVMKGTLRVENDEGLLAEVPAGKMIFLPKGLYSISDIIPQNDSFEAMMFFFDKDVMSQFLDSVKTTGRKEKCITHFVNGYDDRVRTFAQHLLIMYGSKKAPARLTGMKLFELLHLIHAAHPTNCFSEALATLNNKEKKSLHEFMNTNFSKPLSIEDYAYLTGRTLSTFRRDFKTLFGGISPKQWLIEKRLQKAHALLSAKNITVSDVVMEIGYENIPHFIKAFHKKYGASPKQFLMKRRKEIMV